MRPSTEIVTDPERVDRDAEPLTTPIYETTTFVFETAEQVKAYNAASRRSFSTRATPTRRFSPSRRAWPCSNGAETALLLSSGMAATATALLSLLKSGDEVVCSAAIYGGTLHLIADMFPRYGIKARFVQLDELAEPERVIGETTRVVWFESPINPTLRCVDIEAIGAGLPRSRRDLRSSTTRSPARSISSR